MPVRHFNNPATEARMLADVEARNARLDRYQQQLTQEDADRVRSHVNAAPWMRPGQAAAALSAQLDADEPVSRELASVSAEEHNEADRWDEGFLSDTVRGVRAGLDVARTAATLGGMLIKAPFQEFVSNPVQQAMMPDDARGGPPPSELRMLAGDVADVGLDEAASRAELEQGWFSSENLTERRYEIARDYATNVPELMEGYADEPEQQFVSPGRLLALELGQDPGTTGFNIASGAADFALNIADPVAIATGGATRAAHARKVFGGERGMRAAFPVSRAIGERAGLVTRKRNPTTIADEFDHWLSFDEGAKAAQRKMTESQSPSEIWQLSNRKFTPEVATELADAGDANAVGQILRREVISGRMREKFGPYGPMGPVSRGLGERLFGEAGRASGVRVAARNASHTRAFQWMPRGEMDLKNPQRAVVDFDRFLENANLPKHRIAELDDEFIRAAATGDPGEMRRVVDEGQGAIFDHLIDGRHRLTRDQARRLSTGVDPRHAQEHRAYAINYSTGRDLALPGSRRDAMGNPVPSPALLTQMGESSISMPDVRELRRATGKFRFAFFGPRTGERIALTNASVDAMSKFMSSVFMPGVLFSVAWPVRVGMEQTGRQAAAGLHGIQHPGQMLSWMMTKTGRRLLGGQETAQFPLGRGVRPSRAGGPTARDAEELGIAHEVLESLNKSDAGWRGDMPGGITSGDTGRVTREHELAADAWGIEIDQLVREPVAQRIAGGLTDEDLATLPRHLRNLDPDSREAQFAWWWEGGGREFREQMMRERPETAELLSSREGAERFFRDSYEQVVLHRTAGGDQELLDLVADGVVRDGDDVFELNDVWFNRGRRESASTQALRRRLKAKMGEMGEDAPNYFTAPRTYYDSAYRKQQEGGVWNRFVDGVFNGLFSAPDNKLFRVPVYKQNYWNRAEELVPFANGEVRQQILDDAVKAGIPNENLARIRGRIADSPIPDEGAIDNLDAVNMLAKSHALDETKRLLYDVTERRQFSDITRTFMPFMEAYAEIAGTWARLAAERGAVSSARRVQQGIDGSRSSPIFYTDPVTEEEMLAIPGTGALGRWMMRNRTELPGPLPSVPIPGADQLGFADPAAPDEVIDQMDPRLSMRVSGLNVITMSIAPGMGPLALIPASMVFNNDPSWDPVKEFVAPFGFPEGESVPQKVLDGVTRAWGSRALAYLQEDPEAHRDYANLVGDMTRLFAATGDYGDGEAEFERMIGDARKAAGQLYPLRIGAQFTAPSPPTFAHQIAADGDTQREFDFRELSRELRTLQDEHGFDEGLDEFIRVYGLDVATAAGQSKSRATEIRSMTEGGYTWERNNPDLVDRYEWTIGLFAPDPDGEFEWEAYVEDESRAQLSPEQIEGLRNNRLGWLAYDHAREMVAGRTDDAANRWLQNVKAELKQRHPGFDSTIAGLEEQPEREEQIAEISEAVTEPRILEQPQGQAARAYMEARAQVERQAAERHGIEGWNQANSTRYLRRWLLGVGEHLAQQVPEFEPMWGRILRAEVEAFDDELEAGDEAAPITDQTIEVP